MGSSSRLPHQAGQHTTEFVILIGLVTVVAVVMQPMARRGIKTGVKAISDLVLGEPPPPNLALDASLTVTANSTVTEAGDASFLRVTTMGERTAGNSLTHDTRSRTVLSAAQTPQ